jgi:CRP/FNR family transcriptional regulator, polysaccharide utilization system transcription regulator
VKWINDAGSQMQVVFAECKDCQNNCCKSCLENNGGIIFKSLTKEELDALFENKQRVKFKAGETILKQNTDSSHLVCIRKGMAKLFVEGVRERNLILKIIKDSEIIISGGILVKSVRPYTVTAITELECCFINIDKIIKMLLNNSGFAVSFIGCYYQQYNQMFGTLINLTQKYMPGRVADTLLYLKNQVLCTNPFTLPLTRQELSEMSAMTKESFVRILTEFKNSKIIRTEGRTIEILYEQALAEISKNG